MKEFKICIVGNSVALRTRPNLQVPGNKNYTELLQEELSVKHPEYIFRVENKAVGAYTVKNVYQHIDEFIHVFPRVFILNIGVVDACTREVPLWFYRLATNKSKDLFSVAISAFYRAVLGKMRPFLVYLRCKRSWVSKRSFRKYYSLVLETLKKETNSYIIILPISQTTERIEKQLPGSADNHKKFNALLRELAHQFDAVMISLDDLVPAEHIPDGIHFSREGHGEVTKKLAGKIAGFLGS